MSRATPRRSIALYLALCLALGLKVSGCDSAEGPSAELNPQGAAGESLFGPSPSAGSPAGGSAGGSAGGTAGGSAGGPEAATSAGVTAEAGSEPGEQARERLDGLPSAPQDSIQLSFPIAEVDRALIGSRFVIGVDHDPGLGASQLDCEGHDGRSFPSCYDEHRGSDFMLEGGFNVMDAGSAQVVAAAAGLVVEVHDGEYDRCHADLASADVSCDGYPMRPNYVTIEHEGGWRSDYLHLKRGSLLVSPGDVLSCGEPIALIGSSGYSSAPHLHLELTGPLGRTWDPFAGERSQPYSLWGDEGESGPLPLSICLP